MTKYETAIKNRYEFVIFFDVENGNPNGDPDAGNMPRIDPETSFGIVTDVCLKRKIRNYIELIKKDEAGFKIYIKEVLSKHQDKAYNALNIPGGKADKEDKGNIAKAQQWMCENYFDIRAFGAVMSTGKNWCGTLRGPIQLNFARSVEAVIPQDITITRMAKTNEERAEKGGETEMGRKNFIPYGLYRGEGYISAALAQDKTGFNEGDLKLFWDALINMFEHDHSAARGKMAVRKLIVFRHDDALGNAPSHQLFDKITVKKLDENKVARAYGDYQIIIDKDMPQGVQLIEKV